MKVEVTGRWRVGVDLSNCVPILEEEVLEGDVVIMIVFGVVEPEISKYY